MLVNITVNLTPALTGVKGEMWIMFVVDSTEYWYYLVDIPLSVNGIIGPFGYTDGYPNNFHQIRFPEQSINGITYEANQTGGFMITQDLTFNITLTPTVGDISTTLTISSPSSVVEGESFNVSGILYETDTGIPIPNQPINLSYNGNILGSANTGVNGDYLITANIPTLGSYILTAQFLGTSEMKASKAKVGIRIGGIEIQSIAIPGVVGIVLLFTLLRV